MYDIVNYYIYSKAWNRMGVRAGQGYGAPKPKRLICPSCGRKGVTQWKISMFGRVRECQYCRETWGEPGWALALKAMPQNKS
ncbi:MSHA biogenesis protein MshE [Novimethylophilus kurashikiensis]|uniref:MSHA biogenesis protein MshE n=1 Tax=Novimethylophilus kurashikiensis TaxID=1825523 RepID=A0A2R5F992_9PROT|nr:MSHA biogenesis protein MshE [Novimethylophilus kurashikiensis]